MDVDQGRSHRKTWPADYCLSTAGDGNALLEGHVQQLRVEDYIDGVTIEDGLRSFGLGAQTASVRVEGVVLCCHIDRGSVDA